MTTRFEISLRQHFEDIVMDRCILACLQHDNA
jgi:hypothetical protein